MSETLNYKTIMDGTLVASGPGAVSVTPANASQDWAIGTNNAAAPGVTIRHALPPAQNTSMELEDGEHLYIFGNGFVAVTADVPAPGSL